MNPKYSLTPEHRDMIPGWTERWIRNAMSTEAMTDEDRRICRDAVRGMYRAANLEPPPDERIVFVPSPFVARFAGGFAAAVWAKRSGATNAATAEGTDGATCAATYDATYAATNDATYGATETATYAATDEATDAATFVATFDATRDATRAATFDATRDATRTATDVAAWSATRSATQGATETATLAPTFNATYSATDGATYAAIAHVAHDAKDDLVRWYRCDLDRIVAWARQHPGWLESARDAWMVWSGGNQLSGVCARLSFFRDVAGLHLSEYEHYQHYEALCLHSGPRMVHRQFCIISDRPERLLVDDRNRPHCEDGPFCRWRDGSELYAIHGVYVPAWVVLHPERITAQSIAAETNAEVRRIMIERMGVGRYLTESGAKLIDMDGGLAHVPGSAPRALMEDATGQRWLVGTDGSTERVYHMAVPVEAETCAQAHMMIAGLDSESRIVAEC